MRLLETIEGIKKETESELIGIVNDQNRLDRALILANRLINLEDMKKILKLSRTVIEDIKLKGTR